MSLEQYLSDGKRDLMNSYHILGDAAFPVQKYLLTPYKSVLGAALDPVHTFYNKCFSSKRQVRMSIFLTKEHRMY